MIKLESLKVSYLLRHYDKRHSEPIIQWLLGTRGITFQSFLLHYEDTIHFRWISNLGLTINRSSMTWGHAHCHYHLLGCSARGNNTPTVPIMQFWQRSGSQIRYTPKHQWFSNYLTQPPSFQYDNLSGMEVPSL